MSRKPTYDPDPNAEWWSTTDVAAYLKVDTSAVSKYRGKQMPEEDGWVMGRRAWRPATIIDWHAQRPGKGWRRKEESNSD